jgi:hypothetical protein
MRGLKASFERSGKFTLGEVHGEFTCLQIMEASKLRQ